MEKYIHLFKTILSASKLQDPAWNEQAAKVITAVQTWGNVSADTNFDVLLNGINLDPNILRDIAYITTHKHRSLAFFSIHHQASRS